MKIAVVDSGITAGHPHIGPVAGGVSFTGDGDLTDRLGHGTAVAAAIRQWAPDAELYAVKIFGDRLSTNIGALLSALEWCRANDIEMINLSLGTVPAHADALAAAIRFCPLIVSPASALPGSMPSVVGVEADPSCPRDRFRYAGGVFYASPYPRPIPGVPPERNLSGVSFAVANVTGLAASASALTREILIRAAA
jgi:subtilisin family serine protease